MIPSVGVPGERTSQHGKLQGEFGAFEIVVDYLSTYHGCCGIGKEL